MTHNPYPYELATPEQGAVGSPWWCIHHDVKLELLTEPVENRVWFIREHKPEHEVETRLRAMRPVKGALPVAVVKAYAAWRKAHADWEKAGADWEKANADREKANAALEKANADWEKARANWEKAHAAWRKAYADQEKAYADYLKAYADYLKADADYLKADADWRKAYADWRKANADFRKHLSDHADEIDALFVAECHDVAWGPEGLIFPEVASE